ncbi:MAG: hypothetical protein ACJAU1_001645 [Psychromonas sp.]
MSLLYQDADMTIKDQLPRVVAAFQQWRNNRNGRQVATPDHLRQQAVLLLEHCSSCTITSALRISATQLKQWRELCLPAKPEFVSLPVMNATSDTPQRLELRLHNGVQLSLSGLLSSSLIVDMIHAATS